MRPTPPNLKKFKGTIGLRLSEDLEYKDNFEYEDNQKLKDTLIPNQIYQTEPKIPNHPDQTKHFKPKLHR